MEYYSNCIIEAIKAKIRHPFKIKILWVSPVINEVFCPHVMWTDGEKEYDFWATKNGLLKWYEIILHKGKIRKLDVGYYSKYVEVMKRKRRSSK